MIDALTKKRHIHIVESARGLAAFYVAIHHIVIIFDLKKALPQTVAISWLLDFFLYFGTHAVILFFLLSGFSIHYVSIDRMQWNGSAIRNFYYLRWRRIYPIFVLAILLALLAMVCQDFFIGPGTANWPTMGELIATPLFLTDLSYRQGVWFEALSTNGPLWSLSYEIVYYLLYPLFWLFTRRYGITKGVIAAGALSAAAIVCGKVIFSSHLFNVIALYFLWCLGALLAEFVRRGIRLRLSALWVFPVLVGFVDSLWVLEGIATWRVPGTYQTLCGLAFFLVMLLFLGGFKQENWNKWTRIAFSLGAVATTAVFLGISHVIEVSQDPSFYELRVLATGLLALAWLYLGQPNTLIIFIRKILAPWHQTGAYSYGLYVLHYPLFVIAISMAKHWLQSPRYLIAILAIVPVIYLAKVAELKLQPKFVKLLDRLFLPSPVIVKNAS